MLTFERRLHLSLTFDLIEMQAAGAHTPISLALANTTLANGRQLKIFHMLVKSESDESECEKQQEYIHQSL